MKYKKDWIQIYIGIFHVVLCSLFCFGRNLFLFQQKITIKLRAESDHVKTLCLPERKRVRWKRRKAGRWRRQQCCLQSHGLWSEPQIGGWLVLSVDHPDQRTGRSKGVLIWESLGHHATSLISKLTKFYIVTDCHNFMMDSDILDNRDNAEHLYSRK